MTCFSSFLESASGASNYLSTYFGIESSVPQLKQNGQEE
jgi:hypothetical protein